MARFIKRGKVWQYEISTKDNNTGKYKKIRKSGFDTKRSAMTAASEMELKLAGGFKVGSNDISLLDYYNNWLSLYKKDKIAPRTYLRYLNTTYNIKKYFPNDTLKTLNRQRYQYVINDFSKTHATATVKQLNIHIHQCIRNAVDDKIIEMDFTKNAILIGQSPGKKENEKYLNYEDFQKLMAEASKVIDPRYVSRMAIFLGGMTGLRFGEIVGLTWDNIDFENSTLTVNKSYDYVHKFFAPTKNEQSMRTIAINSHTIKILREFKDKQLKLLESLEIDNADNFVFFHPEYGIITNNSALHTIKRFQKKLDISPMISMHGLRHTHASVLLLKGVNILAISKRLGHKTVDVTLAVYSHLLKELEEQENENITNELENIV